MQDTLALAVAYQLPECTVNQSQTSKCQVCVIPIYIFIFFIFLFFLPSVAYDPEGFQKLDRLQKTTKLAGMTCHLVNKAVMKKNCVIIIIIISTKFQL